jgi:hypothetical protein
MNMTTEQNPLISGFGPKTAAEEALAGHDLRGKIAIVTGGHAGIGLETTRVLANVGATVVIGSRGFIFRTRARVTIDGILGSDQYLDRF